MRPADRPVDAILVRMPAIDLESVVAQASMLTRVDRKYVIPAGALPRLVSGLGTDVAVLTMDGRRSFGYRSTYLDTLDLRSFRETGQRRRRRFKVRSRTYVDSGATFLEVKTRGPRGVTEKTRVAHPDLAVGGFTEAGAEFARHSLHAKVIHDVDVWSLVPTMTSEYHRSTLYVPAGAGGPSRVTVDTGLCFRDLWCEGAAGWRWDDVAIVETKTGSLPGPVDKALWRSGFRPSVVSKYGTGLAVLRPELSSLKWHRVLSRHAA